MAGCVEQPTTGRRREARELYASCVRFATDLTVRVPVLLPAFLAEIVVVLALLHAFETFAAEYHDLSPTVAIAPHGLHPDQDKGTIIDHSG